MCLLIQSKLIRAALFCFCPCVTWKSAACAAAARPASDVVYLWDARQPPVWCRPLFFYFFIHRQGEVIIWIHHPSPWLVLLDSNDYNYYMVWEPPPAVQLTHSVNTQLTRYRNGTGIHRVTPTGDHTHWVSSSVVILLWELWKLKEKIRSFLATATDFCRLILSEKVARICIPGSQWPGDCS